MLYTKLVNRCRFAYADRASSANMIAAAESKKNASTAK